MIRKLIGLFLIGLGIFLEVLWLGVCFGTVIVGIILVFFAPQILFFPFTFFSFLGWAFMKSPTCNTSYSNYDYQSTYRNNESSYSNNAKLNDTYDNLDQYYKILESDSTDDFNTIKKNYHKLIKVYHYDTVISKDLPDDMLKFAEDRTKELNEAYAKIRSIKT